MVYTPNDQSINPIYPYLYVFVSILVSVRRSLNRLLRGVWYE